MRENLLTPTALAGPSDIPTLFVEPLPDFDQNKMKGLWVYEQVNPFPSQVPALEATSLFPVVIKKNDEVIIRDKATNKILMAVY